MGEVQGMQGVAELKRFSLKTKGMVYWSYMGTRHGVLRENVMEMLGLKETVVQIAKANGVRWYGHILRREDGHVLRKALEFEVKGKRKRGQPKKTWKMQAEKESKSVGLEKEDTMKKVRWRVGVGVC